MRGFVILALILFKGQLAVAQVANSQSLSIPSEIAVEADAWSWVAADTLRITVLLEESGNGAVVTSAKLKQKKAAIETAWKNLALADLKVEERGKSFSGGDTPNNPISSAATVKVEMLLGARTVQLDKAEELIDVALKAGASAVVDVNYSVEQDAEAVHAAITDATTRAQKKAELIAKSMGVKLGRVLAVTETEEAAEKVLRLKRQRGEDTDSLSDRDVHVYVSLRYEVAQ